MSEQRSIFVAGHLGLVGSAIVRRLRRAGADRLIVRTRAELDLQDQAAVNEFFTRERPELVYLAAAKVGGIVANDTRPAEFIAENLRIQSNVIESAYRSGTQKLLFLGSSCIYPKHSPQPIKEEYLLTGPLEPTNEWYAIAKLAGLKLCQAYRKQYGFNAICVMPTNLYGPEDNFDLVSSHVVPALIRKFLEAVESGSNFVEIWGSGTPRREFLHVDDLADACVFLMDHYCGMSPINVGWGEDILISDLAAMVARAAGFKGELRFDRSKPDGTPRKLLDISRLSATGWQAKIPLEEGICNTIKWYRTRQHKLQTSL